MKTNLNFNWKYIPGFKEEYLSKLPSEATTVDIPHSPTIVKENYFSENDYQGVFTYEKIFDKPETDADDIFELVFEGIMLKAHIYLNGVDLKEAISGWYELRYDVTGLLKEKDNRLLVIVDSNEDKDIPPFGKVVDYLTFSGIYRPVFLYSHNKKYIKRLDIIQNDMEGNLQIRKEISNLEQDDEIIYQILDDLNNVVAEFKDEKYQIKNPHLWSIDDPYLYTLKGIIKNDGKELFSVAKNFGFRTFEFKDTGFYLNKKKVKLIGLNRHQNYPLLGCALPKSSQEDDARIIKYECGCNIVRTSHYSQSEDFLNECDRIGLLVQTEVPGWQFIDKNGKTWRNNFYSFIKRMVEKEMIHTSLISYGIRIDESEDDDELYSKAITICKELDPNRATTGVRNFKTSSFLEDYYSYNDFSCSNISHGLDKPSSIKVAKGKGILISENMGHMYPTKQFDEPERRLEHVLRHLRVINDAYKYDYLGEIGWCAFDYNTHQDFGSGDHICYHGVMDIYRNPKAAAYAYLSQNSKEPMMYVANPYQAGDYDECRILPLYILTNADEIKLYKNKKFIKSFYPDKKDYPNLKHPPIIIDDFIGNLFDEGFNKRQNETIVKALNYVGKVGYANIKKSKVAHAFLLTLLHGKKITDLFDWYGKYVACWGSESSIIELVAIKDNKEVLKKKLGPSTSFHYDIKTTKNNLINEDTYDTARVSIFYLDQYEEQCHYAFKQVSLKTEGPIEILGTNNLVLKGGDISFYVKSKRVNSKQSAKVIINTEDGFSKEITFEVE